MKRAFGIVLLTIISLNSFGQDNGPSPIKEGRPNLPGTLRIDFGYSFSATEDTTFNIFGSRSFHLYYQRDIRLGNSKFSFHPGIGFGFDRLKFDAFKDKAVRYIVNTSDSSYFAALPDSVSAIKSMLVTNYLEVPLELRFTSNPDDEKRTFKAAIGFKVGYLIGSFSKLKYRQDEQNKKLKDYQNFHLSPLRYGPFVRVGVGGFNVYANYMISPLFKTGEGNYKADYNIMTVGVSWPVF